jgi:hypothetical protein
MVPSHCPTCGTPLQGQPVCSRCGTLIALEARLARAQSRVGAFYHRTRRALVEHMDGRRFLWACAVVPMFIVPPLVSLSYSIASMRRSSDVGQRHGYEWMLLISAINIILSVLILVKFREIALDQIAHLFQAIEADVFRRRRPPDGSISM